MNLRGATVHKALVSASKVCREGYRIILDSEPGQRGMLQKKVSTFSAVGFLRQRQLGERGRQFDAV